MVQTKTWISVLIAIFFVSNSSTEQLNIVCPISMTPLVGLLSSSKQYEKEEILQKHKIIESGRDKFEKLNVFDIALAYNSSVKQEVQHTVESLLKKAENLSLTPGREHTFKDSVFYKEWSFPTSYRDLVYFSSKNASEFIKGTIQEMEEACLELLSVYFGVVSSRVLQHSGLTRSEASLADEKNWRKVVHALITESSKWRAHNKDLATEKFVDIYMSGYSEDPEVNKFSMSDMQNLHHELVFSVVPREVMECNKNNLCKIERVFLGLGFLIIIVLVVVIRIGWLKLKRRKKKSTNY